MLWPDHLGVYNIAKCNMGGKGIVLSSCSLVKSTWCVPWKVPFSHFWNSMQNKLGTEPLLYPVRNCKLSSRLFALFQLIPAKKNLLWRWLFLSSRGTSQSDLLGSSALEFSNTNSIQKFRLSQCSALAKIVCLVWLMLWSHHLSSEILSLG